MPRRPRLFPRLLTGLRVRVLRHPDPSLEGLEGLVIREGANSIQMLVGRGRVLTVLKHSSLLEVEDPRGGYIRLRGEELLGSPVERVKEYRWRVRARCLRGRR